MNQPRLKALCVALSPESATRVEPRLRQDFDCRLCASVDEARALLSAEFDFALVITDYASSDIEALNFQRERRERWPDTVGVMLVTQDALEIALTALQDGSVYRVLRAPWQAEELATALAAVRARAEKRNDERHLREQLARIHADLDEKIQDLDEANELLEYWVEFSPAVLYSFSCDHGALHPSYISKNFFRLTGYERTAAVVDASFWKELIHPGDAPRYREALLAVSGADSNAAVLEYRVRHRDGTYLNVLDSMRAVRDGDGETIEVVGAWLDVSARG